MVAEGFPSSRVGVIHNGIDPGRQPDEGERMRARKTLGFGADAFLVGSVARLDPVKDLKTLIAAYARLHTHPGHAALVLVGDGEERAALEACARDLGVAGGVHFVGYRADIRHLLAAFDVYVNSSVSEGVSLTILEAMATGLPVVATRVGGTPEVVLHGNTGLLVEPRDPAALATAIDELGRDRDRGRALGAAGRVRVDTFFTIDRMVSDYARVYTRLGRH
jgi:glycosyltransferase involved in cell wall biosynthesis